MKEARIGDRDPRSDRIPMSEQIPPALISRRTLLRRGAAAAALVAGVPLSSLATRTRTAEAAGRRGLNGITNVRVSNDRYGVHVGPSVAANPRHPRQLLAACQAAPTGNPQVIATYLSFDAGATWQNGGLPRPPAGKPRAGDDVTVAFDPHGRGYVCASATGSSDADRALYAWRTDDGGRSFSAPVTLRGRTVLRSALDRRRRRARPRRSATSTSSGPATTRGR